MLSDVGITPTITYASPDEWSTASNEKAYDISYTYNTGGGNFSVDDPMRVLFDGERGNPRWTGFYVNDEVQALQDELTQTADDEGGIELMEQIGQILVDDAALVPMYQQPELWGVSMDLDWTPSAVSYDFKDAVWK
jgi:ABC-type transport system substrate-binding protein